jgi:hypothetical protein
MFANFKRRLLQYIKQSSEVVISIQMVMLVLTNIMIINSIFTIATKKIRNYEGDDPIQRA